MFSRHDREGSRGSTIFCLLTFFKISPGNFVECCLWPLLGVKELTYTVELHYFRISSRTLKM